MLGLSGGGWTTTVASAVVTDIDLSFPTAGSMPKWRTKTYDEWVPELPFTCQPCWNTDQIE